MPNEADTCRKSVVPKLQAVGWDNDPHSIAEQRYFTDGRIVVRGSRAERRKGKRADYLLRYTRDFTLAVVEAKAEFKHPADGLQQAKEYAQMLGLKFAYATNGQGIVEFDFLATYQSIARDERRPGLYREFAPDFFDLIIVDECHRGSAKEESNWREILEYFEPAYQLGMTATPLRGENRDTYLYFGNPVYTYSLKQGIDDGFLAPYRVHRIITQWDAAGWRPSKDELDRYGRLIPDEQYQTADFERLVALRARTQAIARHLTDFLKKTDRFAKTIVFCVDQEHASEMRAALNNLNADLVGSSPSPPPEERAGERRPSFPDYVCRVTADEGDIGRGHMQRFQDVETRTPVILTTSQLLTTGLDAPTCRNVVLVRLVNSMVEFKQIIGRGTRVRDDYGKLWFNILDYTGTATRNFADPAFDGDPAFATQEEIDEYGQIRNTVVLTAESAESAEDEISELHEMPPPYNPLSSSTEERAGERSRKYYFDGGQVEIAAMDSQRGVGINAHS